MMTAAAPALADEVAALMNLRGDLVENPYPLYKRLRAEAPVFRNEKHDLVMVTTWDTCRHVLVDPAFHQSGYPVGSGKDGTGASGGRLFTRKLKALEGDQRQAYVKILDWWSHWIVRQDGEHHRRLRKLVHKAFTPRAVNTLDRRITEITDELIDGVADTGQMELIDDFAWALPLMVVCEMIEVPTADRRKIRGWAEAANLAIGGHPDTVIPGAEALDHFREYVMWLISKWRSEGTSVEVLTQMLGTDESGDRLNDEELFVMTTVLLLAGHETTTKHIGNALHALLTNRNQWELLCSDPGGLARQAGEESLRYDASVQGTFRIAVHDSELAGTPLYSGETILIYLASANRDETQFEEPDRLDIRRDLSGERQMGFGLGPHYCLGAHVNRLEVAKALETLARRFPDMEIDGTVRWASSAAGGVRGVETMPLVLGRDRG